MLHPISFSIPDTKLCKGFPIKTKFMSDLIPGDASTYIYDTEEDYYKEYQHSYFAITKKKAGWDCMRHYEILANRCIPYFIDIQHCPENTMALLPKNLFIDAIKLHDNYKNKQLDESFIEQYRTLQEKFTEYTKNTLTTDKMATYVLNTSNFGDVKKILYLSGNTDPDYLRCLTLHGFKSIFGKNCHDYPKIPHIYRTDTIRYDTLYGKGMSYTNLLDARETRDDTLDGTIVKDIENKVYDIIIYGSYHRGMPLYDNVCKVYKPNEIILLCGEDIHRCNHKQFTDRGHHVFVRELF